VIRVGHFIDSPDPGGAETLVAEICARIPVHGFDPVILLFENPWLQQRAAQLGIKCATVPAFNHYKSIKTLPLFIAEFARFLKTQNLALLHSHLFGSIAAAGPATAIRSIGHVGTLHDTYTIEERPSRAILLQFASLLGTRLVTVSKHMQEYLEKLSSVFKIRTQTVYNGVDLQGLVRNTRSRVRRELRLSDNCVVLICVARLVPLKRHDVLITSLALIGTTLPFCLLIVGEGPTSGSLEEQITSLQLGQKIKLLGPRNDVPDLLAASDCFVMCSDFEGLSMSIIESMAAALPAVVTNVGGNAELVIHNESGYLVEQGDANGLATCLHEMVTDEVTRRRFGQRARKLAERLFSIDNTVQQYVKIYHELLP
jgi:L-malate glycosyltransferase